MTIFIWLLWHSIAITCTAAAAKFYCQPVSMAHLDYLIGIGGVEVIFEIAAIMKIFVKKNGNDFKKYEEDSGEDD